MEGAPREIRMAREVGVLKVGAQSGVHAKMQRRKGKEGDGIRNAEIQEMWMVSRRVKGFASRDGRVKGCAPRDGFFGGEKSEVGG
jgi:hypothetical protein